MFFCAIRWAEDKEVAAPLIEMWPYIVKLVDFYVSLPASRRPNSNSYTNIKAATKDVLTVAIYSQFTRTYFKDLSI